jgi:hypothetical protein
VIRGPDRKSDWEALRGDALGGDERSAGFTMCHQKQYGAGGDTPREFGCEFDRSFDGCREFFDRRGATAGPRGTAGHRRLTGAGPGGSIRTRGKDLGELGSLWFFTRHEGLHAPIATFYGEQGDHQGDKPQFHPDTLAPREAQLDRRCGPWDDRNQSDLGTIEINPI